MMTFSENRVRPVLAKDRYQHEKTAFRFATICLALIRFIQRIRDFFSRDVSFYAAKADYGFTRRSAPA
jgi:hypothetical protein